MWLRAICRLRLLRLARVPGPHPPPQCKISRVPGSCCHKLCECVWICRRYRIYDALAAPRTLQCALLSFAIDIYSQYWSHRNAASGLRTRTRAFIGSNLMKPRPNAMVRNDCRARKVPARRNLAKRQILFTGSFAYSCTRVLSNLRP